jgi:hypothetical protein
MTTVLEEVSLEERLAVMPVGWQLLRELETIEPSTLDGCDLPAYARAVHRLVTYVETLELINVDQVAHCTGIGTQRADKPVPFARQEIGHVYHWTDLTAGQQLQFALDLRQRLPALLAAMRSGDVDYAKALRIVKATNTLEDVEKARQVVDVILPEAPHQTTTQIARRLYRLIAKVDPEASNKRAKQKKDERRVSSNSDGDGIGSIHVSGVPVDKAAGAIERVDSLARGARNGGDVRTLEQLRADVAVGLLDGTWDGPDSVHRIGVIELTVPLTTLMDLQDLPGEVAGWGAVCADMARQTAEQMLQQTDSKTTTRFTVYDDDGNVAADGVTRRRPPAPMAASIRASINRCVFPGCWRPARDCDLDHQQREVDGGETTADNMHPLCRRHHRAKDEGGWRYEVLDKGVYQWTSPLGQVVVEDRRRFRTELDEDRQHGVVNGLGDFPEQFSAEELVEALVDILADAPEDLHRADPEPRPASGRSDERTSAEASDVATAQATQPNETQPPQPPVTTQERPADAQPQLAANAGVAEIAEERPVGDREARDTGIGTGARANTGRLFDDARADRLTTTRLDDGERGPGDGLVGC